jgi:hypothetical protein
VGNNDKFPNVTDDDIKCAHVIGDLDPREYGDCGAVCKHVYLKRIR